MACVPVWSRMLYVRHWGLASGPVVGYPRRFNTCRMFGCPDSITVTYMDGEMRQCAT
jgi:hypothetical protein